MLTRDGSFDEEELADAAKNYLPLYGKAEREECRVPYKEASTGAVNYIVFIWLAGQWVFVDRK